MERECAQKQFNVRQYARVYASYKTKYMNQMDSVCTHLCISIKIIQTYFFWVKLIIAKICILTHIKHKQTEADNATATWD